MNLPEYLHKYPLTKGKYTREDVQKIRKHAFLEGNPAKKMTRSEKQNKYYWGVVLKILGMELGYYPDEIHQLMAKNFLGYEKNGDWFVKSTTKLNTTEMEEYMDRIRRFAAMEVNVTIPLPNETEFDYDIHSPQK